MHRRGNAGDKRHMEEPTIHVGIIEVQRKINGWFNGPYLINHQYVHEGGFAARTGEGCVILFDDTGNERIRDKEVHCLPLNGSTFTLFDVTVGIQFHWERKEEQTFQGALHLVLGESNTLTAINEIKLEEYITSVISSEMNPEAPFELLKAHAIMSRSWVMASLNPDHEKHERFTMIWNVDEKEGDEILCWYGKGDHTLFDVCADDHCQRYQGITRSMSGNVKRAVDDTRGVFLTHNNVICDARYHKACGGITDDFRNTWEDREIPYLSSISDAHTPHAPLHSEDDAKNWILSRPDVYCNTEDENLLNRILPALDWPTKDFFRWKVEYDREELENIIKMKSGMDVGTLENLIPLERGPSSRIIRLKIIGSKKRIIVGKELEIRRWLSPSHLYSSAFIVTTEGGGAGNPPERFIILGAGWGHGVGLCQIGAAVMAIQGFSAEDILKHYFRGTTLQKRY